jgi:hypothetical protein
MQIVIRPAAAADIEDAFVWYEQQRLGLGSEFLKIVDGSDGYSARASALPSDTSQYPKSSTSALSVRHLLPDLPGANRRGRMHARETRSQAWQART